MAAFLFLSFVIASLRAVALVFLHFITCSQTFRITIHLLLIKTVDRRRRWFIKDVDVIRLSSLLYEGSYDSRLNPAAL